MPNVHSIKLTLIKWGFNYEKIIMLFLDPRNWWWKQPENKHKTDITPAERARILAELAQQNTTENYANSIDADTQKFIDHMLDNASKVQDLKLSNRKLILTARQQVDLYLFVASKAYDISQLVSIEPKQLSTDTEEKLQNVFDALYSNFFRLRYIKDHKLPRTINIVKHRGKTRFLTLTNQQFAFKSAIKNVAALLGKGKNKTAKICYDMTDYPPTPMARLQIEVGSIEDIKLIIDELKFSHKHNPRYIDQPFIGGVYTHKKNDKETYGLYLYSELATCSLKDLIEKPSKYLTKEEIKLVKQQQKQGIIPTIYQKIFHDALSGLAEIHRLNGVHRDIKPENILLYRNADKSFSAKISDFGWAATLPTDEKPISTESYASPQVLKANQDLEYFFAKPAEKKYYNFGEFLYDRYKDELPPAEMLTADPKDDIFALGVSFFELFTRKHMRTYNTPEDIAQLKQDAKNGLEDFPILRLALGAFSESRFSATEILNNHRAFDLLQKFTLNDPSVSAAQVEAIVRPILEAISNPITFSEQNKYSLLFYERMCEDLIAATGLDDKLVQLAQEKLNNIQLAMPTSNTPQAS